MVVARNPIPNPDPCVARHSLLRLAPHSRIRQGGQAQLVGERPGERHGVTGTRAGQTMSSQRRLAPRQAARQTLFTTCACG